VGMINSPVLRTLTGVESLMLEEDSSVSMGDSNLTLPW
jgi:hypothetical protein